MSIIQAQVVRIIITCEVAARTAHNHTQLVTFLTCLLVMSGHRRHVARYTEVGQETAPVVLDNVVGVPLVKLVVKGEELIPVEGKDPSTLADGGHVLEHKSDH